MRAAKEHLKNVENKPLRDSTNAARAKDMVAAKELGRFEGEQVKIANR